MRAARRMVAGLALLAGPVTQIAAHAALPLGPASLAETQSVEQIAPGVRYSLIERGGKSAQPRWRITMGVARTPSEVAHVTRCLERLRLAPQRLDFKFPGAAMTPYAEMVAGDFSAIQDAKDVIAAVPAKGCHPMVKQSQFYPSDDRGPWRIHLVEIDPSQFHGKLVSAHAGTTIASRGKVSDIVRQHGAMLGINGGFFVMTPADGVEGEPAGISVLGGRMVSEPTANRPWVLLDDRKGISVSISAVQPQDLPGVRWDDGKVMRLDGVNREPALLRNCGALGEGTGHAPWHDRTCHMVDQIIALTDVAGFVPHLPPRSLVARIDANGAVEPARSTDLIRPGETILMATGQRVAELRERLRSGNHATLLAKLQDGDPELFAVNGGPLLVKEGQPVRAESEEGWPFLRANLAQANEMHGWVNLRAPRTAIGVRSDGTILLVVVDGQRFYPDAPSPIPLNGGMTIEELRQTMISLGAKDALNLDGGGSSVLVIGDTVANQPSDKAGERAVGDAVLLEGDVAR